MFDFWEGTWLLQIETVQNDKEKKKPLKIFAYMYYIKWSRIIVILFVSLDLLVERVLD